ncbi:hypothetical protein ACFYUV_43690 [Nonomuraea sp. NPDC003560]|uniref:hypothetical protein n=1 Tax=Nonomuraea sp. NPDC003560 TaxID=3364341 RepID=UPI00367D084F
MEQEDWEWPKGLPPAWEAPEGLRVPTASVSLNLALQMLSSNIVGNDEIEVIAEFVLEKARFEQWTGRVDPPVTLRQRFAVDRAVAEGLRVVHEAWVAYEELYRTAGARAGNVAQEREALLSAVREATAIVVRARTESFS